MLFCQLGRADSLREICNGLSCCLGRLVHLGISKAPCRSTLSYANEHRPAALFEELFWTASARFREQQALGGRKHKFRFKNKLLSLDSTTISLCLTLFPWAKFRRAKGGVKAHVLLDHDDYLPAYVLLTEAKRSDIQAGRFLHLEPRLHRRHGPSLAHNPLQIAAGRARKLSAKLVLCGLCLLLGPHSGKAQTLRLRLPLADAPGGATTASDTSVADVNVAFNMRTNGVGVDLHGAQGTGVTNSGAMNTTRALDLTSNTAITQGATQPSANGSSGSTIGAIVQLLNSTGNHSLTNLGINGSSTITNFTVTLWFNQKYAYDTVAALGCRFFVLNPGATIGDKGAANSLALYQQDANFLEFGMGTSLYPAFAPVGTPNYVSNHWYYVAETYDGANFTMYVGGITNAAVPISTNAAAGQTITLGTAASMCLGNRGNDQRGLNGWMQDFRFYSGAGNAAFVESIRGQLSPLSPNSGPPGIATQPQSTPPMWGRW